MIKAQIVGATGYGGLGMVELLQRHPGIEIVSLLAKTDFNKPISELFPHLRGFCDQKVEEATPERVGADADLVIFATPDRVGMAMAGQVLAAGAKMIDYSGDFRFGTAEQYSRYALLHPSTAGQPHTAPELLSQSVYGIPELFRSQIKDARLVGNPGCFAVAMTLGLAPAVSEGIVDPTSLIVDGKTGSSGAGKKPGAVHHFPERNESCAPYRLASHQHSVETTNTLTQLAGEAARMTFVPHLLSTTRGILCTAYANLRRGVSLGEVYELYRRLYEGEPFVRIHPPGVYPGLKSVLGSNLCDISLALDAASDRLIIVSSIDNLVKGQAGNALQNINIMFGFPETMGLERLPTYP
ncbi:MAG: N-acetyl-gamma-glutamyl-phosphate reductase [Dehalococcoidia bacterium]|nr:N-acetyl-gamma-glutamyl-phosphate reductase [Dehalococcoidia bacterium]